MGDTNDTLTSLLEGTIQANRLMAECAACGELWRELELPPKRGTTTPVVKRVRVACPHQVAQAKEQAAAEEQANRHREFLQRFEQVLPPKGYSSITLATITSVPPGALDGHFAAERYLAGWVENRTKGRGMLFAGPTGTLKTLHASAVANAIDAQLQAVIFTTVRDMQARLRAFEDGRAALFYDACLRADLLVLDDFGQEKVTEWAASELFSVINARYADRRPILITTNLGKEALKAHYVRCLTAGAAGMPAADALQAVTRILSRLRECCATVKFTGPDQRENTHHDWLSFEENNTL